MTIKPLPGKCKHIVLQSRVKVGEYPETFMMAFKHGPIFYEDLPLRLKRTVTRTLRIKT
jgi:hypothetical protein